MQRSSGVPRSVILFSTADWDTPYWTNKQHMTMQFSMRGCPVLYVESVGLRMPGINVRDIRRIVRKFISAFVPPRKVRSNVWVLSPFVLPLWKFAFVRFLNALILALQINVFCLIHRFRKPMLWTYHPMMMNLMSFLSYSLFVYHSVDDLSVVPGVDTSTIRSHEHAILRKADFIFTTSLALQEQYRKWCNREVYYFPNVVDLQHFSRARQELPEPVDIQHIPHPRIVYHGALSDYKLDESLLQYLTTQRDDMHWIFIGEEREGQHSPVLAALQKQSNVHFPGYKAYTDLPTYLRHMDVGILPSLINDYTRAMFPMKFFEYIAAGLPVVATCLPALREFRDLFRSAHSPDRFYQHILAALAADRKKQIVPLDRIGEYTWSARFDKMMRIINNDSS